MRKEREIFGLASACGSVEPIDSPIPTVILVGAAAALFTIGLVMIYSTTSAEVIDHSLSKSTLYAVARQLLYACVGLCGAIAIVKLNYRRFLKGIPLLFAFTVFLLLLTLVPGIGKEANGSRRWLSVAGFSFQPSELAKYCAPAFFLYKLLTDAAPPTFLRFLRIIALSAIPLPLILLQPNNGSAAVIGAVLLSVCVLAHIPMKFWAVPLLVCSLVGGLAALQHPYVSGRFKAYLNPTEDLKGKGHQPYQAKIAAGSGRLLGKGAGNSWQKLSYLPEAQNDYIAAIYAEEFGFVGMLLLIGLYAALVAAAFSIALTAADEAGYYLAGAIAFLLGLQVFLNLGVVSGLLPSTGLNLPFFSQGGSSLIANMLGIGLLVSICIPPSHSNTRRSKFKV